MLGWALNEEQSIAAYVDRAEAILRACSDDFELIIIDDGSADDTAAIAAGLQSSRPWLRIESNGRNRGSGYNTKRAIQLASKDFLFWQTVDWAYDLSALPACLPLLQEFDVLQGVRSRPPDLITLFRSRSDNPYKALVSLVNYWLIRVLFRLPLNDYQNVTVYPRRLIQSVLLESESAFTNPECLLKTWWLGARFKEIPVQFMKREQGTAKGTKPRVIFKTISDILRWWVRWDLAGPKKNRKRGTVAPLQNWKVDSA